MTPTALLDSIRRWQPVAYFFTRAIVYTSTLVLGAIAVGYGSDPQPDWLARALAVSAFFAGPLALANITRPKG